MKFGTILKKIYPYVTALVIFVLIAVIYSKPELNGKIIKASDKISAKGMSNEIYNYIKETGKHSFWTGSMFSGMPVYQITSWRPTLKYKSTLKNIYQLSLTKTIGFIFIYLLGFFILFKSLKIDTWLSIIAAFATAFSTYFFLIIEAGHNNKVNAIALLAPVIAGFFFIFRNKWIAGVILTMLFSAIGLLYHPQMTYYFFLMLGVFWLVELYKHVKNKELKNLFIATILFAGSVGIGLATSYGSFRSNQEYIKETIRGGHSELEQSETKSSGLDKDYVFGWSYGVLETVNLFIPNFMGGSSNYNLGEDSKLFKDLRAKGVSKNNAKDIASQAPTYWGNQPFTSGPVYIGAIIIFLFVFSLFFYKKPYKWGLLVVTIFSILLAWGKNFMPLSSLFYDYFPLYDKFRAVSSILVVAEVSIPILAFLGLNKIISDKKYQSKATLNLLYKVLIGFVVFSLLFILLGNSMFDFTSPNDLRIKNSYPKWFYSMLLEQRASMFTMDAIRSLAFVLLAASVLWLFIKQKINKVAFLAILAALIVVDMWGVNKRFFNESNFVTPRQYDNYFTKTNYEKSILQDKDPHFRVLNVASNTFNESRTSYYLKSIGGYHAVKLRRYQDLISEHISKNNMEVLNMLNTKYFIAKDSKGQIVPQRNPNAYGNAWFIDSISIAQNAIEESNALNSLKLNHQAVLDKKFKSFVDDFKPGNYNNSNIKLTSYAPDEINYVSNSDKDGIAVFSEVYYPYGWKALIDGKETEHFRVDYTLRALNIPKGKHDIKFIFRPDSVYKGENISLFFIILMYLVTIGLIVLSGFRFYKNNKKQLV